MEGNHMDISTIFMPVITLVTAQITVIDLAKFRFKKKKLFMILLIQLVVQVTACAAVLISFGYDIYALTFAITMDVPAFLTFYYISKRRDFRDVFTVLITLFLSFTISIPSMWISQLLGGGYFWYNIIRIIVFVFLIFFIHTVVRTRYIQIQDEMDTGWGVFCILPAIGSGILYYQYLMYSRNGDFSSVALTCIFDILMMATVFFVFNYVLQQLHEKYLVQEQRRILDMQNKAQLDQFEQQREAAEKSNRRWHDLRHSIQQLIEFIETGNTELALSYLKEQQGMDSLPKEVYCLHAGVNSILCLWAARSRKAGIQFDVKADIPDSLGIEPMELTAVFANAIENAFEACMRISEEHHRFIKIEANYNGRRLAIAITNSCLQEISFEDGFPVSTKKSGGIGTKSIAYTVKRFSGTTYFEAQDGVFTARFILNVPIEPKCAKI